MVVNGWGDPFPVVIHPVIDVKTTMAATDLIFFIHVCIFMTPSFYVIGLRPAELCFSVRLRKSPRRVTHYVY